MFAVLFTPKATPNIRLPSSSCRSQALLCTTAGTSQQIESPMSESQDHIRGGEGKSSFDV